ncbi:GH32 C-terminal domain-containing protein [Klebsiella michiganensis]|uniref:GH32 C-terminal domain-containing protein n=1 Tax=Klebsiella michiganensis TaxID=1134687 RepID=UPI0035193731
MKSFSIPSAEGITIEFWLRQKKNNEPLPLLVIKSDNQLLYKIQEGAGFFNYYHYTHHQKGELTLSYDEDRAEISLFYYYDKTNVYHQGVIYLIDNGTGLQCYPKSKLKEWYTQETFRPQLHFSPFQAWMNDPNGLCKIDDTYHMFYQFNPNSTEWGPMHWGHAISNDLISWTHLPVFNHPEHPLASLGATGGAFSGTTFINNEGEAEIFYTERLPAYDLYKDYIEVQKKAAIDRYGIKATHIQTILEKKIELVGCDIRDPKVWFDSETQCYRMILGSVYDGNPSVLQFVSRDSEEWAFENVLYTAPGYFAENKGRCVECPDFFQLGAKWVLTIGIVGYQEPETKRHNLLYAIIGTFDNGVFTAESEMQVLDFATEYYALQTFKDGQRQVGIAWLFNWAMKKPIKSSYNGEMSIPKEIFINANNEVAMRPVNELEKYVDEYCDVKLKAGEDHRINKGESLRIRLEQGLQPNEDLILAGDKGEWLAISYRDGYVSIEETVVSEAQYRAPAAEIKNLEIIFDAGIVELFINDGEICATKRSYKLSHCKQLKVNTLREKNIRIETLHTSW